MPSEESGNSSQTSGIAMTLSADGGSDVTGSGGGVGVGTSSKLLNGHAHALREGDSHATLSATGSDNENASAESVPLLSREEIPSGRHENETTEQDSIHWSIPDQGQEQQATNKWGTDGGAAGRGIDWEGPGKGEDMDEALPPVPPDGGWGWVIVAASFVVNGLVDGVAYSFSILYVSLMDYFQSSPGKTAWVGTLVPGLYLIVGPFVSAFANKYGCRRATIIGSVTAALFFFISAFANSINVLIFTYGVMGGVGFGFMYLPSICIVSYYFDRKRALSTGIAVCGSGIGTFIFPPLYEILLRNYGWRGTLMIIGALVFHCAICGALYRPLLAAKPKPKTLDEEKKKKTFSLFKRKDKVTRTPEIKRGTIMTKIIEQKERIRTISTHSLDGTIITKDNQLVNDPALLKLILQFETAKPESIVSTPNLSHLNLTDKGSGESNSRNKLPVSSPSSRGSSMHGSNPHVVNKQLERVKHETPSARRRLVSGGSSLGSTASLYGSRATQGERRREVSRPMYRQDIFYTGSVTSIPQCQRSTSDMGSRDDGDGTAKAPDMTSSSDDNCGPFCSIMKTMLDFSLFKSATFAILCLNAFLAFLGFFTPFMYLPHYAIDQGVDRMQATLLVSIIGVCNTGGRVLVGWLADRPWADSLLIQNVALIVAGLATASMPFITNYYLLCVAAAVFGLCVAAFIALRSIVTGEMLGIERLTNAFGLIILFQGIAGVMGAPLAGLIYQETDSYRTSFVVAGAMLILSGVVCIPARRVARWERGANVTSMEDLEVGKSGVGGGTSAGQADNRARVVRVTDDTATSEAGEADTSTSDAGQAADTDTVGC